ncbi:hypothetical protein D3C87_1796750 [compost metagenome]
MGEHFAFQPAERQDPTVDTGAMSRGTGEQHFTQFGVAGGGVHDCPHSPGQVGIRHSELLRILQSGNQMEERRVVRFRRQLIPDLVFTGQFLGGRIG